MEKAPRKNNQGHKEEIRTSTGRWMRIMKKSQRGSAKSFRRSPVKKTMPLVPCVTLLMQ